jgi:hypothetical protein
LGETYAVNYLYDGKNLIEEFDGSGNVFAALHADCVIDEADLPVVPRFCRNEELTFARRRCDSLARELRGKQVTRF